MDAHGEDAFVTINGLTHHYHVWGEPDSDPLVLLHGLTNYGRYWEKVAQDFARTRRVYAPDLRGHGQSEHAPGGYLVWAFAQDLKGFVEQLDIEQFDLVAHSLGSRVAMAYARDHSSRLRHLVLVDMGPEMARSGARGVRKNVGTQVSEPRGFKTEEEALPHFERQAPESDEAYLRRQIAAAMRRDEASGDLVYRYDKRLLEVTGKAAIAEIPYLWESLEHIQVPTLVVRGENSSVLSPEIAQQMLERLPDGRLAEIPGVAHYVAQQKPREFYRVVSEFLGG
jgi:pimeloyl-ACP methyl ester carboxylesterase